MGVGVTNKHCIDTICVDTIPSSEQNKGSGHELKLTIAGSTNNPLHLPYTADNYAQVTINLWSLKWQVIGGHSERLDS